MRVIFIGMMCFAMTSINGNLFGSESQALPLELQSYVNSISPEIGEFELELDLDEPDVYELQLANVSFKHLLKSKASQLRFINGWAQDWYHKGQYLKFNEASLVVLANSDLTEVCRYYLGQQAVATGAYETIYQRHLRFPLNFISFYSDVLKIERAFGSKRILSKAWCKLEL